MFVIEEATEATDEVVEAVAAMLPLLSSSAPRPTSAQVAEIAN